MASVTLDTSEVHDLAGDLTAAGTAIVPLADQAVTKMGFDVVRDSAILAPKDTGDLANSVGVDFGFLSFEAGPTVEYGGWVEEGTDGPYEIPNAWGRGITVIHPGNRPQPYMAPAFDRNLIGFEQALGDAGVRAIR
jgi:hypothetical protein